MILAELIRQGLVAMLGPIRQEILSGIRHEQQFRRLSGQLAAFPDIDLFTSDYESAASLCNQCLRKGIQASHTDFLIAAAALDRGFSVLTTDKDFGRIAQVIPVQIYKGTR